QVPPTSPSRGEAASVSSRRSKYSGGSVTSASRTATAGGGGPSASSPTWSARTIDAPRSRRGSGSDEATRTHGVVFPIAASSSSVPSVEPFSTRIHGSGRTDCAATLATSRSSPSASLRSAVRSAYPTSAERCRPLERPRQERREPRLEHQQREHEARPRRVRAPFEEARNEPSQRGLVDEPGLDEPVAEPPLVDRRREAGAQPAVGGQREEPDLRLVDDVVRHEPARRPAQHGLRRAAAHLQRRGNRRA